MTTFKRVSVAEAAEALGICYETMAVLVRSGRVRGAVKYGPKRRGYWLIPVDADGRPWVQESHMGPRASWSRD